MPSVINNLFVRAKDNEEKAYRNRLLANTEYLKNQQLNGGLGGLPAMPAMPSLQKPGFAKGTANVPENEPKKPKRLENTGGGGSTYDDGLGSWLAATGGTGMFPADRMMRGNQDNSRVKPQGPIFRVYRDHLGAVHIANRGSTRVPGKGDGTKDTVPAMLAPGEAVLNKAAAEMMGRKKIAKLNRKGATRMGML